MPARSSIDNSTSSISHLPVKPTSDILPLSHSEYNAQLLRSSTFSDCTIRCDKTIFHLHRCILSPRCEFFWKCFDSDFEEASTAHINMDDDDPHVLERMIRWIYCLQYPSQAPTDGQGYSLTQDLELYMIADKYGLSGLMDVTGEVMIDEAERCAKADQKFAVSIRDWVDTMLMLFDELPEREDLLTLRHDMLNSLAPMVAKHIRQEPSLQELMRTTPDFAMALVECLVGDQQAKRHSTFSVDDVADLSQRSHSVSRSNSPQQSKTYIPLNEDSEDEME